MKHCLKINCCDELGQIKSQETLQTLVWPTDPLGCTIHWDKDVSSDHKQIFSHNKYLFVYTKGKCQFTY